MLYSSSDPVPDSLSNDASANSYPPFIAVDSAVVQRIMSELDALEEQEEEGNVTEFIESNHHTHWFPAPSALVGALVKALCCKTDGSPV
jgi:hypothetical protein